jgi:hypothetical protein
MILGSRDLKTPTRCFPAEGYGNVWVPVEKRLAIRYSWAVAGLGFGTSSTDLVELVHRSEEEATGGKRGLARLHVRTGLDGGLSSKEPGTRTDTPFRKTCHTGRQESKGASSQIRADPAATVTRTLVRVRPLATVSAEQYRLSGWIWRSTTSS